MGPAEQSSAFRYGRTFLQGEILESGRQQGTVLPTLPGVPQYFEDMRDFGIAAHVRVQVGPFWKNIPFNKLFDSTLPAPAQDLTRDDIVKMGYKAINILDETGRARADGVVIGLTSYVYLEFTAALFICRD